MMSGKAYVRILSDEYVIAFRTFLARGSDVNVHSLV